MKEDLESPRQAWAKEFKEFKEFQESPPRWTCKPLEK